MEGIRVYAPQWVYEMLVDTTEIRQRATDLRVRVEMRMRMIDKALKPKPRADDSDSRIEHLDGTPTRVVERERDPAGLLSGRGPIEFLNCGPILSVT